jgi:uncharacterized protein
MNEATSDWLVAASLAPVVGGVLEPLYRAAAGGVLQMPFCGSCEAVLELGQVRCDVCASTACEWRVVGPTGTIHSATMVHRLEPGLVVATAPYAVVDVELASGHRIIMTTAAPHAELPRIGDDASIAFRMVGDVAIPSLCMPGKAATDTTITSKGTS